MFIFKEGVLLVLSLVVALPLFLIINIFVTAFSNRGITINIITMILATMVNSIILITTFLLLYLLLQSLFL
jgi:hypothetical protein